MFRIAFLLFVLLLPATGARAWGLGPYVEHHFATGYTDQIPGDLLGFGLVPTKSLRLWLGGGFELGVGGGSSDFRTQDASEVKFVLGPELGVNYHVQPRISIGVTAWYQHSFGGALQDSEDPDPDCLISDLLGSEDNYDIREHAVGLRVSVLFRTRKDVFR